MTAADWQAGRRRRELAVASVGSCLRLPIMALFAASTDRILDLFSAVITAQVRYQNWLASITGDPTTEKESHGYGECPLLAEADIRSSRGSVTAVGRNRALIQKR